MAVKAVNPEEVLKRYRKLTKTRYKMAIQVYEAQDSLTKEVIDRIRDRLVLASTGIVSVNGRPVKLEQKYIDFNILFLACEIVSDLAILGIQVGNFKPSKMFCMECKKKILGVNKPKKARR
jgi:hypothetical protein